MACPAIPVTSPATIPKADPALAQSGFIYVAGLRPEIDVQE
jgi:hypothetical protein